MARRIGEPVQENQCPVPAPHDESLLVVALARQAEKAHTLVVGALDVLEAPGRPDLLGHGARTENGRLTNTRVRAGFIAARSSTA